MSAPHRLWRWLAARPFRSSLLVMVCFVVPGYVRQEQTIDRAQRAADRVAELQAEQEADRVARAEDVCRRSVEFRDDNRAMWLFVLDLLAGGELIPTVAAELDRRLPALECDADNQPAPAGG